MTVFKTMFSRLREENARNGFGNLLAVANESAIVRDFMLEEMGETPVEVDLGANAEEKFKDEEIEADELEKILDKIPESELDDAAIAAGKTYNTPVPDVESYVGGSVEEAMEDIDLYIPDTEFE